MNQPSVANRSGSPFTRFRSSSKPAKNMRNVSPMSDNAFTTSLGCVNFSTSGPMSIPSASSITTEGTRKPLVCSEMIGARTAAAAMRTRLGMKTSLIAHARCARSTLPTTGHRNPANGLASSTCYALGSNSTESSRAQLCDIMSSPGRAPLILAKHPRYPAIREVTTCIIRSAVDALHGRTRQDASHGSRDRRCARPIGHVL